MDEGQRKVNCRRREDNRKTEERIKEIHEQMEEKTGVCVRVLDGRKLSEQP